MADEYENRRIIGREAKGAEIPMGFTRTGIPGTESEVNRPEQVAVGPSGKPLSEDIAELRSEIADLSAMLAAKGTAENPSVSQLSGSTVQIGGKDYTYSGSDNTLRGLEANLPNAGAAHAVLPHVIYWSVDAGTFRVTTGTAWEPLV